MPVTVDVTTLVVVVGWVMVEVIGMVLVDVVETVEVLVT